MRQFRRYVYWSEGRPGTWRAFFPAALNSRNRYCELFITKEDGGYEVWFKDASRLREKPFPSLNLAKRAGSTWLREQAGERAQKAKPGGGRQ